MIRYRITKAKLERLASCQFENWIKEAGSRTEKFRKLAKYEEKSAIWSEIKPVFMAIQHNKCAYCEQLIEGGERGRIAHDLEHFRPKARVKRWPTDKMIRNGATFSFGTGEEWIEGYYLLAYNLLNYATACKPCNSVLKANYFPIRGNRGPQSDDPQALRCEQPLLIYPISTLDENPEDLITFVGPIATPKHRRGIRYDRALVTIEFFELNERADLRRDRMVQLTTLWTSLQRAKETDDEGERARMLALVDQLRSDDAPHANCTRSFYMLITSDDPSDRELAEELAARMLNILGSANAVPQLDVETIASIPEPDISTM